MENATSSLSCKLIIVQVGVEKKNQIDITIHTFLPRKRIDGRHQAYDEFDLIQFQFHDLDISPQVRWAGEVTLEKTRNKTYKTLFACIKAASHINKL